MKKWLWILLLIITPCLAAEDIYQFTTPEQQTRFEVLTTQLRCLVCQNQNIAESNAPLAADLREQIYQHIRHGQSNQQIVDYLVARYGDFILYRPPFNLQTMCLWLAPFLLLLMGLSYLFYYLWKMRRVI
jgi:cytochrome c-type biogenesis protein CcmH